MENAEKSQDSEPAVVGALRVFGWIYVCGFGLLAIWIAGHLVDALGAEIGLGLWYGAGGSLFCGLVLLGLSALVKTAWAMARGPGALR